MPTKGEITRGKILVEATQVFHRKGFLTTTTNDLLDATGMTKGNHYFHFAGKEEVGLEVLRRARVAFRQFPDVSLQGETPCTSLESFFRHAMERNSSKGFVGGCPGAIRAIRSMPVIRSDGFVPTVRHHPANAASSLPPAPASSPF